MSSTPNNFLALESTHSEYDSSRFVVLPIPYDATATFGTGSRHGPSAIISASAHVEYYDDELAREYHDVGIATLDPLETNAAGPDAMHADIFRAAKKIVDDGKFLIGLGGDHSITAGLVRAVLGQHKKLSVLQIDAHLDLRDKYQESKYSHACVMRRVVELGANVVPVGIRSVSQEEHRFAKRAKIKPISARECMFEDNSLDHMMDQLGDDVYVTIDIDGFDPSLAPGTGTPEPGGLDWYQVTGLLQLVALEKRIVAADVVEVSPIPGQCMTEYLAARLIYKLIGYVTHTGLTVGS